MLSLIEWLVMFLSTVDNDKAIKNTSVSQIRDAFLELLQY